VADTSELFDAFDKAVTDTLLKLSASTDSDETNARRKEGILYLVIHSLRHGDDVVCRTLSRLLPTILSTQATGNVEYSGLGLVCLQLIATGYHTPATATAVANVATGPDGIGHENWRVRAAALSVLRGLAHGTAPRVEAEGDKLMGSVALDTATRLLADKQPEIRDAAVQVLAGMLRCAAPSRRQDLLSKLPAPLGRRKQTLSPEQAAERLAGVLGGCALVISEPSGVPEWLPKLLATLCQIADRELTSPVGKAISDAVAHFRRSHQDGWEITRLSFPEEELQELESFAVSRSYFS